jgi:hypothetical protein
MGQDEVYIGLDVDDLLIIGANNSAIAMVNEFLSNRFQMKDLG